MAHRCGGEMLAKFHTSVVSALLDQSEDAMQF